MPLAGLCSPALPDFATQPSDSPASTFPCARTAVPCPSNLSQSDLPSRSPSFSLRCNPARSSRACLKLSFHHKLAWASAADRSISQLKAHSFVFHGTPFVSHLQTLSSPGVVKQHKGSNRTPRHTRHTEFHSTLLSSSSSFS